MTKLEKVIKGLDSHCTHESCDDCPYDDRHIEPLCLQRLLSDALELLKAQEPVKPVMRTAHGQGADEVWYECGECNAFLGINRMERRIKCPKCGKPVKWE